MSCIPRDATISARRLCLRPLEARDAGLIALYCADARVATMTSRIPHPYPPGAAQSVLARAARGEAGEAIWAIARVIDGSGDLIGMLRLNPCEGAPDCADLGYWVAPAFWGSGLAGEAVDAVVSVAPDWGLTALVADVFTDNAASIRVLTRAGFELLGPSETFSVARGRMVETWRYRLDLSGSTNS